MLSLLAACQPEAALRDDALQYMPTDVTAVAVIRPQQMMNKADFEAVRQMEFYREMVDEAADELPFSAELFEDPARTGIDLEQNMYLANWPAWGESGDDATALFFSLADTAAFARMVDQLEAKPQVSPAGYRYSTAGNDGVLAWDGRIGLAMKGEGFTDGPDRFFKQAPEASLAANRNLQQCLEEDFDMALWLNANALPGDVNTNLAENLGIVDPEALRDNYIHNYVFFEEGRIRNESRFFIRKKLRNDLDLFFREGVEEDLTPYIPGENLEALLTVAFDLPGIDQLLVEKYSKGFAEEAAQRYGFSLQDLLKALEGDMALGIYPRPDTMSQPELLFVATITDHDQLRELFAGMEAKELLIKLSESTYELQPYEEVIKTDSTTKVNRINWQGRLWVDGDRLVIARTPERLQQIQSGDFTADSDYHRALSGERKASIFTLAGRVPVDKPGEASPFGQMRAWTDRETGNLILETKDGGANSLNYLLRYYNEEFKSKQERKI